MFWSESVALPPPVALTVTVPVPPAGLSVMLVPATI